MVFPETETEMSGSNVAATSEGPEQPETAMRRGSEATILKIVEKRIRDGAHQDKQQAQAKDPAAANSEKPEAAVRRGSEATILKVVEKRIRDGTNHQGNQKMKQMASADPPELSPAVTSADQDYLDNLTLQKVVDSSLRSIHAHEEEDCDNVKEKDKVRRSVVLFNDHMEDGAKATSMKLGVVFDISEQAQGGAMVETASPGAYQGIPGSQPVRTRKPRFSALGRELSGNVGDDIEAAGADLEDHRDLEEGGRQRPSVLTNGSSKALSVATLVQEGSSAFTLPLPVAKEFGSSKELGNVEDIEEGAEQKKKCVVLTSAAAAGVILVAVTLLLVFLLGPEKETEHVVPSVDAAQTDAPTLAMDQHVLSLLPASTVRIINLGQESPQSKAYQWILQDPNVASYAIERLMQRFALATFYYATSGPIWKNQTNWLDYSAHECSWFHRKYFEDVELYMASGTAHTFKLMYNSDTYPCSQNSTGSFEHLWIYKNGLAGRLPMEELSLLTSLKSMALFGNELDITLSSELGKLSALEGIEFSSLDVDGSIPTEIGLLTNLKAILSSSNQITGTIPSEYGLLHQLEYSMLSKNQMSGSLPTELGLMSSLAWLYLYGNQITGPIPTELGQVTTFEFLNMYTNQLTGSLPTEIGQLTRMNLMALSDNYLTGELPSELGRLTNIKQGLSMNRNEFIGTIPTEMGAITGVTGTITGSGTYGLGLGGNNLTGTLPSELGMLSLLERLYVEDNKLTGPLPSELGLMTTMETLGAQNNDFVGIVPPQLETIMQALSTHNADELDWSVGENIEWDLSSNSLLSGTIPDILCEALVFDCSERLCGCDCPCDA